jgi:serine/threonine protein kinase
MTPARSKTHITAVESKGVHSSTSLKFKMSGLEAVLGIVGLALTAPSVVETTLGLTLAVIKKMEEHRTTKIFVQDLKSITLPAGEARLRQDIALGQKICLSETVAQLQKDHLRGLFAQSIQLLSEINDNVDAVVERLDTFFSRKRRAALSRLAEQVRTFKTVSDSFHDIVITLSMSAMMPSPVFLDQYDFLTYDSPQNVVQFSPTSYVTKGRLSQVRNNTGTDHEDFLIESVLCDEPGANEKFLRQSMEILATRLSGSHIAEGILPFTGLRQDPKGNGFQLVFKASACFREGQLLHNLLKTETKPSLTLRVRYCVLLAEAVLHVHSLKLVHKNIRPDNIVIIPGSQIDRTRLFLLGWPSARVQEGQTLRLGETAFERCIYQHPTRAFEITQNDYCMGHDVYSLGVCMLEILTWTPLVTVQNGQSAMPNEDFLRVCGELEVENHNAADDDMSISFPSQDGQMEINRMDLQKVLEALTRGQTPPCAGDRLTTICLRCLSCLDANEDDNLLSPFTDRAQEDVGADFVDLVLKDLRAVYSSI